MQASSAAVLPPPVAPGSPAREAMPKREGMMQEDGATDDRNAQGGVYGTGITEAQLQDGSAKVLFFHAPWCPYCVAHDRALQQWYGAGDVPRSTYKIDYDSSLELRSRYGVLAQHTFVLVDGNGTKLRVLTGYPSDAEVKALIGSR